MCNSGASTEREGPRRSAGAMLPGATSTSEVDAPSTAGSAFDTPRRGAPPNGKAASSKRSVEAFQTAYNENRFFITGDDSAGKISVDGDVGKQTWGAIFRPFLSPTISRIT